MKKYLPLLLLLTFTPFTYGQVKELSNNASSPAMIQLVPIVISSLALLFSIASLFFNYYIQYKKRPEISILLSDKLKSWLGDKKLVCNSSITFFNKGAQYGAVYKMKAELFHKQSNTTTKLVWDMFMQDKHIGKIGEEFKTHTAFESWAETLVIQGRTAIVKKVQFRSNDNFELKVGDYEFNVLVYSGTNKEASFSTSNKIVITQHEIQKWAEVIENFDAEKRIAKKSLSFNLLDG
jgi:hypothetical protein